MFDELLKSDETIAFMTAIHQKKMKSGENDNDGIERDLTDYIKYLIGE